VDAEGGESTKDIKASQVDETYPDAKTRHIHAQELARERKNDEALAEYLWCYDEGMRKVSGFSAIRNSILVLEIVRLGKSHPPALQALRDRRDLAREKLSEDAEDHSAQADFGGINQALGEVATNMTFYDQLPAGSKGRSSFGRIVLDQLIEAKRYKDAVQAVPYEGFMRILATDRKILESSPDKSILTNIITKGGKELEILAGAGRLEEAQSLLKALREVDNSEATQKLLRAHLDRAGHAELAKE
jgi:hypothetical protein